MSEDEKEFEELEELEPTFDMDTEENDETELMEQLQEFISKSGINFDKMNVFGNPMPPPQANPEPPPKDEKRREKLKRIREFQLKPREISDYLDRYVIKQAEAKKVLSVAICDHYNRVRQCIDNPELAERDYAKPNIILMGPTGVGKTYLMRCISKLIGVPFVKADATKFSETGYVGNDVEDMVRDLVKLSDGDTELAQYGIIYIDEVDKIAATKSSGGGKDVSGRGVQVNLLKLMEETDVNLFSQSDLIGQMQAMMNMQRGESQERNINTRHMLFIVSGAFQDLAGQIKRRKDNSSIGFVNSDDKAARSEASYLMETETKDLIDFGFEPEFIGRLPVRVACEELEEEDLRQVLLKPEDSLVEQFAQDFSGYGISLNVADSAIDRIAALAAKEKTGARGLLTVMESIFRDFKYELPSTPCKKFELTDKAIDHPEDVLRSILDETLEQRRREDTEAVLRYATELCTLTGLQLSFSEEAIHWLVDESEKQHKTVYSLCKTQLKDVPFGLKLIANRTGKTAFELSQKVVEDPGTELSNLIVESF